MTCARPGCPNEAVRKYCTSAECQRIRAREKWNAWYLKHHPEGNPNGIGRPRKDSPHRKQDHPSIPYRQFHVDDEDRRPMVPPADRPRLAMEQRLKGMTPEHREAFLKAHRWTADLGYVERRAG